MLPRPRTARTGRSGRPVPVVRWRWLLGVEVGWYLLVAAAVVGLTVRAERIGRGPRFPNDVLGWVVVALPWAVAVLLALARWWRPSRTGLFAVVGLVACVAGTTVSDAVTPGARLWLASLMGVLPVLLVAVFRHGRWPVVVPASLVALYAAVSLLQVQVPVPGMNRTLSGGVAVPLDQVGAALVLVVLPVGIGVTLRLADQRRRAAELDRIRTAERLQVARELHDMVAGHVTGMTMFAGGAHARTDPDELRHLLGSIESSGRDAMAAMHRMVGALRTEVVPDELVGLPTSATDVTGAVHSAIGENRATVRIDPAAAGATVPSDLLTTLHRIVGESLTNVARHAPTAGAVTVDVTRPSGDLVVEVVNDGAPRPGVGRRSGGGYGLVGLAERVATLGGTLWTGPDGPGRWRVHAELPVPDPAAP